MSDKEIYRTFKSYFYIKLNILIPKTLCSLTSFGYKNYIFSNNSYSSGYISRLTFGMKYIVRNGDRARAAEVRTLMPCMRLIALSGRRARSVLIVLNA